MSKHEDEIFNSDTIEAKLQVAALGFEGEGFSRMEVAWALTMVTIRWIQGVSDPEQRASLTSLHEEASSEMVKGHPINEARLLKKAQLTLSTIEERSRPPEDGKGE